MLQSKRTGQKLWLLCVSDAFWQGWGCHVGLCGWGRACHKWKGAVGSECWEETSIPALSLASGNALQRSGLSSVLLVWQLQELGLGHIPAKRNCGRCSCLSWLHQCLFLWWLNTCAFLMAIALCLCTWESWEPLGTEVSCTVILCRLQSCFKQQCYRKGTERGQVTPQLQFFDSLHLRMKDCWPEQLGQPGAISALWRGDAVLGSLLFFPMAARSARALTVHPVFSQGNVNIFTLKELLQLTLKAARTVEWRESLWMSQLEFETWQQNYAAFSSLLNWISVWVLLKRDSTSIVVCFAVALYEAHCRMGKLRLWEVWALSLMAELLALNPAAC